MKNKPIVKEARLGLIVTLTWLSFLACNQNEQPLAPEKSDLKLASNLQVSGNKLLNLQPVSDFETAASKISDDDLATICQRDKNEIGTSTALIGPAGGVLNRAKHQLVIPAGALEQTVKVSFSLLASTHLECELKPYGLKFNKPVRLILNYNGACDSNLNESALKVAHYNPQLQIGVLIPTNIDVKLNTATVEIQRFAFSASNVSRYGLIKR